MTKSDAYKLFVESREFRHDLSEPHNDLTGPGFVYMDQDGNNLAYIAITANGLFHCHVGCEEMLDGCLGKVEAFLWNNFAESEWPNKLNVYHKGDNYDN